MTKNSGPWPRRLGQWLGLVYNDDGTWGQHQLDLGGPGRTGTRNTGPWPRRLGQWLGLIYNDDGTWGQHRLNIKRQPPKR